MKKEESLAHIRHSFAHVLAAAVEKLYPKAQFGIGPVIENGFYYDFGNVKITDADLPKIEKKMREIAKENLVFKKELWAAAKAKAHFKKLKQPYKLDLIADFLNRTKQSFVRLRKQPKKKLQTAKMGMVWTGDVFLDLCRGGHVKNTKELPLDAFKLTHVAGAYWRGDEKNPMLTRVYGIAFATKKELEQYFWQQEEATKRDHRVLGERLKLFTFSELVGPGLPLWLPNGTVVREELERFAKETETRWGYKRIATPHIARRKLFETSGHLPYYQDDMFPGMNVRDRGDENEPVGKSDEENIFRYYLKAMNCPMTMAMFGKEPHAYRELPLRLAEYGTVYRYEKAGVLTGLLRVRGFTQNDAHIFCREDQLEDEFVNVMRLHEYYYRDVFGITEYYVRLSLRDRKNKRKFAGNDATWKKAERIIRSAIQKSGVPVQEVVGEASFYGPKADFQIKSVIGREETASTNQIDFLMPARFKLTYVGQDGKKHPVAVIHRAPLGSHERFLAFLIEHYAGAFPLWLAPEQVWIVPVSDKFNEHALKVKEQLQAALPGLRVIIQDKNETLGKKIREGETQKIPYLLIVGDKEKKTGGISVRQRGKGDLGSMKVLEFAAKARKKIEDKSA